jgi:hypothetical protein
MAVSAALGGGCSDPAAETADGGGGGQPADNGLPPEDASLPDAGPAPDAGGTDDAGASDAGNDDAGTSDAGEADAGADTGQGIGCFLTVSVIEMMGQKTAIVAGGFYPETNIVPFDPKEGIKGFEPDTCRVPGAAVAECAADADCVQGQVCVVDTDQSGKPIPDSGHCENPTGEAIDVGPVTVDGFADGSHDLMFNQGQNGAYTIDGQGDGQADPAIITPDGDYTISGPGDPAQNLGAISGALHIPPFISLVEPVPEINQMGLPEITIDTKANVKFKWEGSSNGYVKITISGQDASVECLARDDGELTVPASVMSGLVLSQVSFFNIVNLERTTYGTMSGPGLVNPQVSSIMSTMVNAKAP